MKFRSAILTFLTMVLFFSVSAVPSWAGEEHTVKKGETLSDIASAYDVSVADIARANSISNADRIRAGETLTVSQTYTVERGDTLSLIAQDHDTTWQKLYQRNDDKIDDPNLIYPGQELVVVGSSTDVRKEPKAETKEVSDDDDSSSSSVHKPGTGSITSHYGNRTHPITGEYKLHSGTDYSAGDGNAYAAKAGTVTGARWAGGYGNMVTIDHDNGVQTRYAHLADFGVSVGEKVNAGEVIGAIGSTGYSTGAHLHFEVLKNGEFRNPEEWLARGG